MVIRIKRKRLVLVIAVFAAAVCILLRLGPVEETARTDFSGLVRTAVIDPGHGGPDGGATGRSGTEEKEINLKIALAAREFCHFLGIPTVMTRETDISLHSPSAATLRRQKAEDLKKRLEIAQSVQDPVYIAIHQNFYGDRVSHGAQTFYHKNNGAGKLAAELLQNRLSELADPENKRKAAKNPNDNFMLENLACPAVIVECGFLSSPEEEMLLNSPAYRSKLAFAISAGIFDIFEAAQKSILG